MASKKAPTQPAAKKSSKAPARPIAKASAKATVKPASKASAKPAAKPAAKPVAKPAAKPVAKPRAASGKDAPATAKGSGKVPTASAGGTATIKPTHSGTITEAPPPPPPKRRGILPPLFGPPPTPPKRSKGAPPPVIAKPKPKKKPGAELVDRGPKKKIDYANAVSVAAAAVQAAGAAPVPGKKAQVVPGLIMISGRRVRTLSLKGIKVKRTGKSSAKAATAKEPAALPVVVTQTKMGSRDLDEFRLHLLRARRELAGRLLDLEEEALKSSGGNLSNMPLHMADVGTDTFDQDFNIGMAQTERGIVAEIDEALQRIANRTYGMCMLTGKPIPKSRLAAKPWAKYTVEAARQIEKSRPRAS